MLFFPASTRAPRAALCLTPLGSVPQMSSRLAGWHCDDPRFHPLSSLALLRLPSLDLVPLFSRPIPNSLLSYNYFLPSPYSLLFPTICVIFFSHLFSPISFSFPYFFSAFFSLPSSLPCLQSLSSLSLLFSYTLKFKQSFSFCSSVSSHVSSFCSPIFPPSYSPIFPPSYSPFLSVSSFFHRSITFTPPFMNFLYFLSRIIFFFLSTLPSTPLFFLPIPFPTFLLLSFL